MNTRLIIASTIGCLIAISCLQSVQAQADQTTVQPSPYIVDSVVPSLKFTSQPGTDALQAKVLMQINDGLVQGWLSAADTSQLKERLNRLNGQESWYKTFDTPIPEAVIQRDTVLLNDMKSKLQPRTVLSAIAPSTLPTDIDDLIGNALAKNHISSVEAESYYLRLAQIESNLDGTKGNPAGLSAETAAFNQSLGELKTEVIDKANGAQNQK